MEEKENQGQVEGLEETKTDSVEVEEKVEEVSKEETSQVQIEATDKLNDKSSDKPKKPAKKAKKEKPQESYEGLTDDEIYTKMQTEKLVQRKKKRKIITAVAMGFAFVLALVVIILATVPVSLKPNCISDNYTEARFYNGTSIDSSSATILKSEEPDRFKKFQKAFDKSFAQSCLSGLFGGALFSYDIEEEHERFSDAMNNLYKTQQKFVGLTYSKARKVTKQSGKVYHSDIYVNNDWTFSFTHAYITVNDESGFKSTKIYIPVAYPDSEAEEYVIIITVKADTSKIADVWSEFVLE